MIKKILVLSLAVFTIAACVDSYSSNSVFSYSNNEALKTKAIELHDSGRFHELYRVKVQQ